ncbi:TRAP transporter large permease [Domibacillus enclensis]|uniref:ABC transporter permease n=1 Tax=Domibacillus enclensis TaxID=1017273 RepID=A0A1N7C1S9_9BACI|nr:TRAP transporter large permease [Domibacillus enclensis]OXS74201.1 ABC transporter permease [Domibacillus enclensis]SIR57535.1 TRAP transporter, DctM subunit [Domibacillus enclensis]
MSLFLLGLFFVLLFLGIPIASALGIAVVTSVILFIDVPLSVITQSMFSSMNSFIMVAVPLFILAGIIMDEGGVADKIFGFAQSMVGWMIGGLGHVNVIASLIFAGMAGSSVADVASTGRMQINAMTKNGYPLHYAAALTLITSMLASIIPPSILMIIAASTAGVSIGAALIGGLIPGLVIATIFMILNRHYSKKNGYGLQQKFNFKEFLSETIKAFPALLAPVILLVGIISGFFTPTEAAAVCVVYTLFVAIFVYKKLSIKRLPDILFRTVNTTGTILFIAVTAKAASWVFEYDGLPSRMAALISGISDNSLVIMLVLFFFLLIVGMFMDATAAIFILVPILMPAVLAVGIDPVFFVVFLVVALSFGLVTPPIGVCLYATSNITGLSLESLSKAAMPWFGISIATLLLFIFIPGIITWPLAWFDL